MSDGNTTGKIVGEAGAANVPAGGANPAVRPETAAEAGLGQRVLDGVQTGLDVAGLIPGVGEGADLVNAGISALRGDWVGAGLSLASAIPFAGWGAAAGKAGRRVAREATERAAKEAAEKKAKQEAAEKSAKEKSGSNDEGKVKPKRMKEHEVKPCFKKNAKGDPKEYDRQLLDQERGLNGLSVKEYLEGRACYQEIGRKGTGAAQAQARREFSKELTDQFEKQLILLCQ